MLRTLKILAFGVCLLLFGLSSFLFVFGLLTHYDYRLWGDSNAWGWRRVARAAIWPTIQEAPAHTRPPA